MFRQHGLMPLLRLCLTRVLPCWHDYVTTHFQCLPVNTDSDTTYELWFVTTLCIVIIGQKCQQINCCVFDVYYSRYAISFNCQYYNSEVHWRYSFQYIHYDHIDWRTIVKDNSHHTHINLFIYPRLKPTGVITIIKFSNIIDHIYDLQYCYIISICRGRCLRQPSLSNTFPHFSAWLDVIHEHVEFAEVLFIFRAV